ncbi:metal-sulfur cluster assembly factor [Alkalihalobacillus sp. BA299]|uniref:metal-sulfur cluster assembly factor n=1 Tax=Alkalihalobacillus sp. BA299 TaxID=2815938 RepID=UPI001AD9C4F3|nr:metal-sulfur cluster assembly factor [Alkalihalobacillus sp. BA299]
MSKELVDQIYDMLEEVNDPELGIDIVNLGLVYEVVVDENNNVQIKMAMTSMGCPMAGEIVADVKNKVARSEEINDLEVDA